MLLESTVGVDCVGQNIRLHAVTQRASASAWAQIRSVLRTAAVESSAMPSDQSCIMCPEAALYRCVQCDATAYYCHECYGRAHSTVNIFHIGELW